MPRGYKHLNRNSIGVFDLIVVTEGCLFIGEEDRRYEVTAGHSLILRPDKHHYGARGCLDETSAYWLHFQSAGKWTALETTSAEPEEPAGAADAWNVQTFALMLPQFVMLTQPAVMYERMRQLIALEDMAHNNWARWKHQLIFQQILELLGASLDLRAALPGANVADQAASYLRKHYSEDVTAKSLSDHLNFHPVYIARCMKREFGCTPVEYLMRYRLEQAKLLLLQTDMPIHHIAQKSGFGKASYFSTCFGKYEGLTPRAYRKKFQSIH